MIGWGESLIKAIGLGLIQIFIFFFIIIGSRGLTYALVSAFDIAGLFVGVGIGLLLLLLAGLIFTVASTIFNTALYVYANKQLIAPGFNEAVMQEAFTRKGV